MTTTTTYNNRAEQCAMCLNNTTVNVPIGGIIYSTCQILATAEILNWPADKMCDKFKERE